MSSTGESELQELARQIAGDDRNPELAKKAREDLKQNLPALVEAKKSRGGNPKSPGEGALFLATDRYLGAGKSKTKETIRADRLASKDPATVRCLWPFVTDAETFALPYLQPLFIPDEEAIDWLRLIEMSSPPADREILEFVRIFFRTRRRETWVPASRALAALALRDDPARDYLQKLWRKHFPGGVPPKWPGSTKKGTGGRLGLEADPSHLRRHTLHACCALRAADVHGSRLEPPLDLEKLAALPLPTGDVTDASVTLTSLLELLRSGATREAVLATLTERIKEAPDEEQAESALREIAEVVAGIPGKEEAYQALRSRLVSPRWREISDENGFRKLDLLWSWLESAAWFRDRGDEEALAQMRATAGRASAALSLRLDGALPGGADNAVEALMPRLPVILDVHARVTTPPDLLAVTFAETLLLLEHPEVRRMPWRSLVRRSRADCDPRRHVEGSVEEAARTNLLLGCCAEPSPPAPDSAAAEGTPSRLNPPAVLLRYEKLGAEQVLRLVGSPNGFIGNQVAVQMERLLREEAEADWLDQALWVLPKFLQWVLPVSSDCASDSDGLGFRQVRLLWRFFQQDPPSATCDTLSTVLRGPGEETGEAPGHADRSAGDGSGAEPWSRLRQFLSAARELDRAFETQGKDPEGLPSEEVRRRYRAYAQALRQFVLEASERDGSGRPGGACAQALERFALVAETKSRREKVGEGPCRVEARRDPDLRKLLLLAEVHVRVSEALDRACQTLREETRQQSSGSPGSPISCLDRAAGRGTHGDEKLSQSQALVGVLREILLGGDEGGGLVDWMDYIQDPIEGLKESLDQFEEAVTGLEAAGRAPRMAHCQELDRTMSAVRLRTRKLARFERSIVDSLLVCISAAFRDCEAQARRALRESETQARRALRESETLDRLLKTLDRLLDQGDERALLDLLETAEGQEREARKGAGDAGGYVAPGGRAEKQEGEAGNGTGSKENEHRFPCSLLQGRGRKTAGLQDGVALDSPLHHLSADDLKRVGKFFLERFRYFAARRFRKVFKDSVQIPSVWSYMTPLFVGVTAGPFITLDIGTSWNELLKGTDTRLALLVSVLLALFSSFLLLSADVASRIVRPATGGKAKVREALRVVGRVQVTFWLAFVWAMFVSGLLLWVFWGTKDFTYNPASGTSIECFVLWQTLLWGSLSLFFGLFLGLILQGRRFSRDD